MLILATSGRSAAKGWLGVRLVLLVLTRARVAVVLACLVVVLLLQVPCRW